MSAQDVLVRAQVLGGVWTPIGSSLGRGIVVEDLTMDADTFGPRACSFTLKRNPQSVWPDISAFTPIEVEVGGIVVWEGRVKETPTKDGSDRQMSVSCEGWQFHLDDDTYRKNYVHASMTDFVDARIRPLCPLGNFIQAGQVTVGDGVITLGFPNGSVLPANSYCGVTLDFGASLCQHFFCTLLSSNNDAPMTFFCHGNDVDDGGFSAGDNAFSFGMAAGPFVASGGTFATPRRYVSLFLFRAAGVTLAGDVWLQIQAARGWQDAAQQVGDVSVLAASTVVKDALSKATLLLSSSTSKIQTTSFAIPDFAMSGPATPREVISAVNAYHNYQFRIGRDRVPEFRPQPAGAVFTAADSGGIEFDDASANSGLDIYSGVTVTYTDASGISGSTSRGQVSALYARSAIQPTNPGAEVNTAGWAALTGLGTLSRTTVAGEFTTGVAGFKNAGTTGPISASTSAWTGGSFIPGQAYRLTLDARGGTGTTSAVGVTVQIDGSTVGFGSCVSDNAFHPITIDWVATSTSAPILYVEASGFAVSYAVYWDNLILFEGSATLVNRRGFRRTKILDTNMALTAAAAQQIGDTYLTGHKTTPFKGSVSVNGNAAIRRVQGGVTVPPHELLFNTGELVRLPHLIDPDTGGIGRDGRIAVVTCNPILGTGTIELDNTRNNLEALLARLAITVGQIPSGQ